MTEDLKTRTASPQPPEPAAPAKPKLDLSISKILGGALAAMTAAALGSRLSVAGTLVGAALASIIAAVAGSIYTASLSRTQEKVRTVFTGRVAGTDLPTSVDTVTEQDQQTTRWAAADPVPGWTVAQPPPGSNGGRPPRPPRGRLNWKGIVVGTLAMFAIAAAALTGFELISGHALSGGKGTTITQVSEPKAKSTPKPKPSARATPTPSASSATPTVKPSASASSTPEASSAPSATTEPTPTASQTPSASASAASPVPSGSATR
jgi:hypothetical protein